MRNKMKLTATDVGAMFVAEVIDRMDDGDIDHNIKSITQIDGVTINGVKLDAWATLETPYGLFETVDAVRKEALTARALLILTAWIAGGQADKALLRKAAGL